MTSLAKTTQLLMRQGSFGKTVTIVALRSNSTHKIHYEEPEKMFRDFNYKLTKVQGGTTDLEGRFKGLIKSESERPLVFVFGWAGASEKNLDKYAEIYRNAGCDTLAYFLPTRFIFSCGSEVPHLTRKLLDVVQKEGLSKKPLFFHNLSDTGLMTYQGIEKIARDEGRKLDIRGNVLDSCPAPRPVMTAPRIAALVAVNYFCTRRDGMSIPASAIDSYRLLAYRALPNLIRRWKGEPVILSAIENKWAGDFFREERQSWPELFLYSKKDFYTPWQFMEETIDARRNLGRVAVAQRWEESGHVSHLKANKKEYVKAVHSFLDQVYFSRLPVTRSHSRSRAAEEAEKMKSRNLGEEEEVVVKKRAAAY